MISAKQAFANAILSGVLCGGAMDFILDSKKLTAGVKSIKIDQDGNIYIFTNWVGEIISGQLQESELDINFITFNSTAIHSAEGASGDRWKLELHDGSHLFFHPKYKDQALTIKGIRGF